MWILWWKNEVGAVEASCVHFVSLPLSCCRNLIQEKTLRTRTAIVFAIIRNHKHDLPFEDVIVNEAATYPGDVLVALHQLELATQEPGGC